MIHHGKYILHGPYPDLRACNPHSVLENISSKSLTSDSLSSKKLIEYTSSVTRKPLDKSKNFSTTDTEIIEDKDIPDDESTPDDNPIELNDKYNKPVADKLDVIITMIQNIDLKVTNKVGVRAERQPSQSNDNVL